ncbi:MAG: DUF3810 family protein [Planctomycetota bacterium]
MRQLTNTKMKNGFWIKLFLIVILFIAALRVLALFPQRVETFFSHGFFPIWSDLLSLAFRKIPFSIFECLLYLWVLMLCAWLVRSIALVLRKKASIMRAAWWLVIRFGAMAAILYLWFLLSWGLNYYRVSLAEKAGLGQIQAAEEHYLTTSRWAASRINMLYRTATPEEADEAVQQTLEAMNRALLNAGEVRMETRQPIKRFFWNGLLDATGTHGILSPFTLEVHLSRSLLTEEIPFLVAHETAHAKGFTSETEANLLAFEACLSSGNRLAQFSAFYHVFGYLSSALPAEERAHLYKERRQEVKDLEKRIRERERKQAGEIRDLSTKTYNTYLKLNSVKEGVKSYSLVGNWIAFLYFDEAEKAMADQGGESDR